MGELSTARRGRSFCFEKNLRAPRTIGGDTTYYLKKLLRDTGVPFTKKLQVTNGSDLEMTPEGTFERSRATDGSRI